MVQSLVWIVVFNLCQWCRCSMSVFKVVQVWWSSSSMLMHGGVKEGRNVTCQLVVGSSNQTDFFIIILPLPADHSLPCELC
jgi:hypothetical protein